MGRKKEENALITLDKCYSIVAGKQPIRHSSKDVEAIAQEYLKKHKTKYKAAKAFIQNQAEQCASIEKANRFNRKEGTSTLMSAASEDIMIKYMYMIAAIARIGGYDLADDDVRTVVYSCLSNLSTKELLKNCAAEISGDFTYQLLSHLPDSTNDDIRQNISEDVAAHYDMHRSSLINSITVLIKSFAAGIIARKQAQTIGERAYQRFIAVEITGIRAAKSPDGSRTLYITEGRNLEEETKWSCKETGWSAIGDNVCFCAEHSGSYAIKVQNGDCSKTYRLNL